MSNHTHLRKEILNKLIIEDKELESIQSEIYRLQGKLDRKQKARDEIFNALAAIDSEIQCIFSMGDRQ